MYELYIANRNYSSWSLRPWVLMTARGIHFHERITPFASGSNFEAFRQFSPTGKVPCLRDGATVVWDSLAIAEYLAEMHPGLWPLAREARTWARCASAEMHAGFGTLRNVCGMNVGVRVRLRDRSAALRVDLQRLEELWSEGLERFGGPYLAGNEFTIVDAFYCPVAFRARTYDLRFEGEAATYLQRLLQLPAMLEWESAALAETWRDAAHDEEILQHGDVVGDLRRPAHA